MPRSVSEFSYRTRAEALRRFGTEVFDLLVIGGGITGASVARDAASRGLSVALVEKRDFAWGTSSRSSKLIHGGLRYLENLEFGLVFEALSERALLLKTAPHMVRPLPFYFPVYEGDAHGKGTMKLGMWLYDLLAMFRTPEFHKTLSAAAMTKEFLFIRQPGLKGGFRYYDASMWDDVLDGADASLRAFAGSCDRELCRGTGTSVRGAGRRRLVTSRARRRIPAITGFRVRDRRMPERTR